MYRNDSPCGTKWKLFHDFIAALFWECGWLKIICVAIGQLISKELFEVIFTTKKPTIFLKISVLATKKRLDLKI